MARAKTAATAEEIPEEDYFPEDARLSDFLTEHGAEEDGVVRVYREGPGGYRDQVLEQTYPIGEFEPGLLLKSPYNGGKFRIYVTIGKATKNFPLRVAVRPEPVIPVPVDPTLAVAPVIAGMMEGFRVLSAQISASANKGNSVEDTIKLFATLQNIAGGNRQPERDPLEMVERVLSLQKQLTPERIAVNEAGEVDTGQLIMQAMKTFGEPFAEIIKQNVAERSARKGEPVPLPALPAPGAAPGATSALAGPVLAVDNTAQPQEENEMNLKLAMVKPLLIASARANLDVETYTDVLLNTFSDADLHKFIGADNWQAELLAAMPQAAEVMPWFERLRADVLAAMAEGLAEETGGGTVPGAVDGAAVSG